MDVTIFCSIFRLLFSLSQWNPDEGSIFPSIIISVGFSLPPTNVFFIPRALRFSHSSHGMFGTGSISSFSKVGPVNRLLCYGTRLCDFVFSSFL